MRTRSKLLLAGLAAALVMASALSTASANNLSVSRTNFRIHWASLTFTAAGNNISCPVLLSGTFHESTFAKVAGQLVGSVTEAQISGACTGGVATVLTETLPWHVQYEEFEGELPIIESITLDLIGAAFRVEPGGGVRCLAGTTSTNPGVGIANRDINTGRITSLEADPTAAIPLGGGFICEIAGSSHFSGNAEVDDLAGELILLALI
jgi:hypothetical protein